MPERPVHKLFVLIITVVVVMGTFPAGAAGAFAGPQTQPTQQAVDFRDVTSSVQVWEGAGLPLRAQTNNADDVVNNANGFVTTQEFTNVPINRQQLPVYSADSEINLRFQDVSGLDTTQFNGQDTQVLVAKLDEDSDAAEQFVNSNSALTVSRALDALTGPNANGNATFELLSSQTVQNGELSESYDLSRSMADGTDRGSGVYMFFVVQDRLKSGWGVNQNGGFQVNNGDVQVNGDARVVAAEMTMAEATDPTSFSITPDQNTYVAGNNIDFEVNSGLNGEVNHTLVVYDKDEFQSSRVETTVNAPITRDLEASDVTIQRSIEDVNGVANIDGQVELFGVDLDNSEVSGAIAGANVVDFVAEQLNTNEPVNDVTNNPTTLDASIVATQSSRDTETLTIETLANWSNGQYQYVYVASADDSTEATVETGTIQVKRPTGAGNQESQSSRSDWNVPIRDEAGTAGVSNVQLDFGANGFAGKVSVSQVDAPTGNAPDLQSDKGSTPIVYLDISVPQNARDNSATLTIDVDASTLGDRNPSDLSIWHYNSATSDWEELETEVVNEGQRTVTFRATTESFSPFAVAEATNTGGGGGGGGGGTIDYSQITTAEPTGTDTPTPTATAEPTATEESATEEPTPEDDSGEGSSSSDASSGGQSDGEDSSTQTTEEEFPGFGALLTVIALLAAALLATRRRAE